MGRLPLPGRSARGAPPMKGLAVAIRATILAHLGSRPLRGIKSTATVNWKH